MAGTLTLQVKVKNVRLGKVQLPGALFSRIEILRKNRIDTRIDSSFGTLTFPSQRKMFGLGNPNSCMEINLTVKNSLMDFFK